MKVSDLQIKQNVQHVKPNGIKPNQTGEIQQGRKNDVNKTSFQDVLNNRIRSNNSLHFSSHAAKRISERNMKLTPSHFSRLEEGLGRVKEKGSQSSLLIMDETAFVVNIKNQTVITAMNQETTRSNVFTNIDSVAIV